MFTKKTLGLSVLATAGVLTVTWLTFSWFESGSEVEVLCANFHAGLDETNVRETLETGEYLRYRVSDTPGGTRMEIDSLYNLGTTRCIVEFSAGAVVVATVMKGR